jgi:hypothetical protein
VTARGDMLADVLAEAAAALELLIADHMPEEDAVTYVASVMTAGQDARAAAAKLVELRNAARGGLAVLVPIAPAGEPRRAERWLRLVR